MTSRPPLAASAGLLLVVTAAGIGGWCAGRLLAQGISKMWKAQAAADADHLDVVREAIALLEAECAELRRQHELRRKLQRQRDAACGDLRQGRDQDDDAPPRR